MLRSILHCDMNNFYASVECMLDPALKKYPIAVCGSVEERHGIVLAKNYKAKAFDVKTGDAVWQAKQKCKDLVVVPPHYEEYIKYSKLARSVYERYTDQVEPYGMDECWLDISGTESLFGSPEKVANEIRETMKFELGLTISVGVSFNKIFAKLGSDMKKPDAVTVIPKDTFREKIWGLPAADLLGVGRATQRVLDSYCIRTIGDLANINPEFLRRRLGKNGVINRALKKLIQDNDLPDVVFHSFRHASITYKLKWNGGDMKSVQGDSGHARMDMVADVYSHIIDEDRRYNAQKFEEQFYNAKGLKNVEEGKTAPMPKFETSVELLDPMAEVQEESKVEEEKPAEKSTDENAALLVKLLSNPETAALLKALAKTI